MKASPIGFSVKDICQTFDPIAQFKKENTSNTFEVHSVTLVNYTPASSAWEN